MVSLINSSINSVSEGSSPPLSTQIAAIEIQLTAYQKRLQSVQQGPSFQSSQLQVQQLAAQVSQLEAQFTQLEAPQSQLAQLSSVTQASNTSNLNLPNAIAQALTQSLSGGASTSQSIASRTATDPGAGQTPHAALQIFMQNLFSALGQENANGNQNLTVNKPPENAHGSSNISANIHSLIKQLNSNPQAGMATATATPKSTLDNLNSSFTNLMGLLNGSQSPVGATTLQSYLENLSQDLGNGHNISGALIDTQV
jgi:hypothetical protein